MGDLISMSYSAPSQIILIADPRILEVPINDNHEPLVNLSHQTVIAYGPSPEIPNNTNYIFLRKTVYQKLKKANERLPHGMHICLYEGYRSLKLQQKIFQQQYKNVKRRHPDWSPDQIFDETTKLVSPVFNKDGSENIPPHSTGGAIDVYLIDDQGKALDMGIHPKDWMKDKDGMLSLTDSKVISIQAQNNRRIMSKVLTSVGFINYPTEYWHWSYGDRYWAFMMKKPSALYDSYKHWPKSKTHSLHQD